MNKTKKKSSGKKKRSIVICSSASFYKQVIEVRNALKKMGYEVVVPLTAGKMERTGDFRVETYKTWFKDSNAYDRKKFLTEHHFNKVAKGDAILVLNYEKNSRPGYIGGAVLMEMGVALHLKKPIYILHPIDESVGYKEEILGMLPVILHGDLARIKK